MSVSQVDDLIRILTRIVVLIDELLPVSQVSTHAPARGATAHEFKYD